MGRGKQLSDLFEDPRPPRPPCTGALSQFVFEGPPPLEPGPHGLARPERNTQPRCCPRGGSACCKEPPLHRPPGGVWTHLFAYVKTWGKTWGSEVKTRREQGTHRPQVRLYSGGVRRQSRKRKPEPNSNARPCNRKPRFAENFNFQTPLMGELKNHICKCWSRRPPLAGRRASLGVSPGCYPGVPRVLSGFHTDVAIRRKAAR